MCGACGSTVYPDPVIGKESTLRQRMLVAQTVRTICEELPGAPRITVLAEGWTVSHATGSISVCHTVEDIWLAVRERGGLLLQQALEAHARVDHPSSLMADVTRLGLDLTRARIPNDTDPTRLTGTSHD
ncbi:MAG: hypothetical protein H7201_14115 [Candidatus Saccharibacteria bacterium]|nr:hypothetical protein [Microbacteriaceae bacterium]